MLGAAGRLIVVSASFVAAVLVSAFVAFRLGIERVTGALHGDQDPVGTVMDWVWNGAHLSLYLALILAVLVVIVGEVARGHKAVSAIAAHATQHNNRPRQPALHDGFRHRRTGIFHQFDDRDIGLNRHQVRLRHLRHVQQCDCVGHHNPQQHATSNLAHLVQSSCSQMGG